MRLVGFDYSRPYYYMVTIKCHRGRQALSEIVEPGRCQMNAITRAFVNVIRNFHLGCKAIAPIECFSIMPDHVHLLIRIVDNDLHLRLETIVAQLMAAMEGRYAEVTGKREEVFAAIWHDWIVAKEGQLAAFTRYIRENPMRHWRRKMNRQYFQRVQSVEFVGRTWYGYGNLELLKLPMLVPIKGHRATVEGSEEWSALVARASRIGPGGAGVSTFMSPLEKTCGHALGLAGGKWVVLSPEGFGERWHPGREYEKFCAEGRMLFLSLWPAMTRQPTKKELYDRCHEMGDVVAAGLAKGSTHKPEDINRHLAQTRAD